MPRFTTMNAAPVSRRRLLRGATIGGAGIAAAALVGCSATPTKPPAAQQATSGATAAAVAGQPKSGGILKDFLSADLETLDRYRGSAPAGWGLASYMTLSRLLRFETGHGAPASGKIIGDLAKSWEQPDPQTIVFHLDPAAKFDERAPTSGRQVAADDVAQSWKRYSTEAAERTQMANVANKDASITTVEAVDPSTVRVKLAFPDVLALSGLAGQSGLWIQPAEGIAGKFDQSKDLRGSGPFMLEKYQPAVGFSFKKRRGWHGGGGRPYLDGVNVAIIPDRAQTEVQFRSKNLHLNAVSQENIPQFAKELKDSKIVTAAPSTLGPLIGLSWAPGQPWQDVRIRRALSMAIDRDAFVNVVFDPKRYASTGIKLDTFWNSPLSAGWGEYWLDPKGKDFGPAAAYLQHNVAEAKKLLDAAGYNAQKPLSFDLVYPGVKYGLDWPTRVDTFQSMAADAGIKITHASIDYTAYIAGYWRGGAMFEGKTQKFAGQFPPGGAAASTALEWLISYFTPKGVSTATAAAWPQLDEMIKKQRTVTEFAAQKAGVHDIQRFVVDNMICVPVGPLTQAVDLEWKALHGQGEIQGWPGGFPIAPYEYTDFWMEEPI